MDVYAERDRVFFHHLNNVLISYARQRSLTQNHKLQTTVGRIWCITVVISVLGGTKAIRIVFKLF